MAYSAPAGDTGTTLDGYISEHTFAHEIGVTLRTIRSWRQMGEGPAVTRIGKRVFYARDDVRNWLQSQRQEVA